MQAAACRDRVDQGLQLRRRGRLGPCGPPALQRDPGGKPGADRAQRPRPRTALAGARRRAAPLSPRPGSWPRCRRLVRCRVIGEPGGPAEAERAVDQHLVAADRDVGADLEVGPAQLVLDLLVALLDGLITNGKFCCVRWLRLSLTWWRRPLRLRASVLQSDVAVSGEPDDPDVDRMPPAQPAPRTASAGGIRPTSCWCVWAVPGRAGPA